MKRTRPEAPPLRLRKRPTQVHPQVHPQKSKEWYEERQKCDLTASEFGAALGVARYKSRNALYKQKKGLVVEKENPIKQQILDYGTNHEGRAREDVQEALREFYDSPLLEFVETGLHRIENTKYAASPDGLLKLPLFGGIAPPVLEIKCPWKKELYQEPFDAGECPLHLDHYCQVQAQMLAVGSLSAYFCCWTTRELSVVQLYRDDAFLDYVLDELDLYCSLYLDPCKEPPRLKKGRYEEVLSRADSSKWGSLLFVKKLKVVNNE